MDTARQIRYFIPAAFFLSLLLIGAQIDNDNALRDLWKTATDSPVVTTTPPISLIMFLASGGTALLASGVFIGAVTHLLLSLIFFFGRLFSRHKSIVHWEVYQPQEYFRRIWPLLAPYHGLKEPLQRFYYYAAITFDHENLRKHARGIHEWLGRRWNWFNVTANSAVGLWLSLVAGQFFLRIEFSPTWVMVIILTSVILIINSVISWCQVREMHEFQSHRP